MCTFLLCLDIVGARGEKKQSLAPTSSYGLLRCANTTKMCTHLVHLSIFSPPKFHIFLIFFLFFQIYCSHAYKIYDFLCHELPGCPNGTQICTRLADMTIFDPTKFQIFLNFLLFFKFLLIEQTWSTWSNLLKSDQCGQNLVLDQNYLILRLEGQNVYKKILRDQVYTFLELQGSKIYFSL